MKALCFRQLSILSISPHSKTPLFTLSHPHSGAVPVSIESIEAGGTDSKCIETQSTLKRDSLPIDQYTQYIVFGFIRNIQALFPNDTFHIIPYPISFECAHFYLLLYQEHINLNLMNQHSTASIYRPIEKYRCFIPTQIEFTANCKHPLLFNIYISRRNKKKWKKCHDEALIYWSNGKTQRYILKMFNKKMLKMLRANVCEIKLEIMNDENNLEVMNNATFKLLGETVAFLWEKPSDKIGYYFKRK